MFKARFPKRFALPMMLGLFAMYSCSEKDYYDPNYGGGKKDNPLDIKVPADMDWNLLGTANIAINVDNDEYSDQYYYKVEVLDADPYAGGEYKVLDAGVAKKGEPYLAEIEYVKGKQNTVFIRETSPVGRVSITPYSIAQEEEVIVTRSIANYSSAQTRVNNTPEEYKEEKYNTSDAIELKGDENWNKWDNYLEGGKSYIIKEGETFTGEINYNSYSNGKPFTLFIKGTWKPANNTIQNANIIVLEDGTMDTRKYDAFQIADNSTLTIQDDGEYKGNDFQLATNVLVKNFGEIEVQTMSNLNTSSVLYNAKGAEIEVSGQSSQYNEVAVFTMGSISNFGEFKLKDRAFKINSQDATCHFYNGPEAIIDVPTFIFGGIGINDGIIKCVNFKNDQGNPTFTNNCSIYICDSFNFTGTNGTIILNKGVIAGGINDDKTFKPVPSLNCSNSPNFQMNNGSMIYATTMSLTDTKVTGGNGDVSLLKASNGITFGWTTYFKGNMVVERSFLSNENALNANGVKMYEPGKSGIIISSCGGSEIPDDNPNTPGNPEFPIEITTNKDYIFAMEDQWPTYGDYDMNDVVIGVSPEICNYIDNYGYGYEPRVKQVKFGVRILAVGALRQIAAAIQLDEVDPDEVEKVEYSTKGIIGQSFPINGNGVEDGQDKAVIPLFENANKLLGGNFVNVGREDEATPIEYTIAVTFKNNSKIKPKDLGHKHLNFFIIPDLTKLVSKTRRPEIHLGGYEPTELANPDLFDKNNENAKKYISNDFLVWGLIIPTRDWICPDENVSIIDTYPDFAGWATTGGKQNTDWYERKE